MCCKRDAPRVEEALRSLGFTYPSLVTEQAPQQQARQLEQEIQQARQRSQQLEKEIAARAEVRQDLLLAADYYGARAEKYRVLGELWQSPHAFWLTGYLPASDAPGLLSELEGRFSLWAEAVEPGPDEDPPVKLKNGFFTEPVEGVVEGYSLPGKFEVDPCRVMAFFYYVLLG